ncbi:hypothetical protein ACT3R7_12135 [Halomonas sp. AOP43-A1-21]
MSRFPRFHGISLAAGAFIENLRAELLPSDPAELSAGRIWYSTAEKALKYTSLDDDGAIQVVVLASGAMLDALASRIGTIESEYASTSFVEAKIAELGSGFRYVGEVTPGVREADALDVSTLGDTDTGAYYKAAGSGYVVMGSGTPRYVNRRDGVLFNSVGGVDVVDNTNSEVDGTEGFVLVTGSTDTGFKVDLDAAFKGRITALEKGLQDEALAREQADKALSDRLDSTEALPGKINAGRFTYQASAAAIEHTISHDLNSLFVSVDVWTEGEDGKYRKDIVTVEETNANRVTVFLSEPARIKATVQVMEAL